MANETITAVPGVAVGHSSDPVAATGVTVLTFPEPNVAVVDVRGGAPGTRETDALGDAIKPVTVNALMFAGGSAFGLDAAAGISAEIEAEGRGAPTPVGPVPIIPAAIVFDVEADSSRLFRFRKCGENHVGHPIFADIHIRLEARRRVRILVQAVCRPAKDMVGHGGFRERRANSEYQK